MHFIEYKKFLRLKEKDIANNAVHRWLAFLDNNISEKTLKELIEMDAAIRQAQKKIEYITNDSETYHQILLREQAILDYTSDINAAERKGEAKGIKKGKKEAEANAKADKMETARSLLDILDVETIAQKFKLTADEIKELKINKSIK
jgi:predicted transposase/invertase (TIGR01784 family)